MVAWIVLAVLLAVSFVVWFRNRPAKIERSDSKPFPFLVPFSKEKYARRLLWNLYQFSRRRFPMSPEAKRRAARWRKELDSLTTPEQRRQIRRSFHTVKVQRHSRNQASIMKFIQKVRKEAAA